MIQAIRYSTGLLANCAKRFRIRFRYRLKNFSQKKSLRYREKKKGSDPSRDEGWAKGRPRWIYLYELIRWICFSNNRVSTLKPSKTSLNVVRHCISNKLQKVVWYLVHHNKNFYEQKAPSVLVSLTSKFNAQWLIIDCIILSKIRTQQLAPK